MPWCRKGDGEGSCYKLTLVLFLSIMKQFIGKVFILVTLSACTHQFYRSSPSVEKKTVLNKILRDLPFFPVNGERFRLSELKDKKAIVIVMRERDCPISEKYSPRLLKLEEKYSKQGVQFIYNYVGQLKPLENGKKDLKTHGFKSPYVIDSNQKIISALGAKTTGDVFILNTDRRIIYRGPLDDQFHLLRSALKPRNHYVSDILDALLAGTTVEPKELPAPGCVISRPVLKKKSFLKM